ncbi:hypothetical protein LPJ70_006708, partial [Coemansia sp. RSA 2708]
SGVGKIIGDEGMQKRGEDRALRGHGEQKIGQDKAQRQENLDDAKNSAAAQKTKGAAQQAGGAMKEGAGRVMGNEQMEEAGRQARAEGVGRADKH